MCKNNRIRFEMKQKGENSKNTAYIASDGSVLDRKYMGTFAWILLEHDSQNNLQQMGIEGCGKEAAYGLDTTEILSYRMEALALLSGLSYLRIDLKWKGKIHWFTDSKAVIDTYKKYAKYNSKPNHTNWIAQRDKDVWEMLLIEQEKWRGRLTLQHVESHVDRKKDEHGNYRIPNATQKMNIAADKIAERTYKDDIPWLNKNKLTTRTAQIYMHKHKVTGHWRRQIEEQLRIDRTKIRAKNNPIYWGVNTEEISWRYMRKTVKNTTIAERKKIMAHIHGKRATKNSYKNVEL